jgi:hypothetical protein
VRRILSFTAAIGILAGLFAGSSPVQATTLSMNRPLVTDVQGDDAGDRYVGSGGLLLPGTVSVGTRTKVASCAGCRWRLTTPCADQPAPGTPFPGQVTCLSVVRGCPDMAELLRAWFEPPGGPWTDLGLVCIAQGGPVTVAALDRRAHAGFVADLPSLALRHEPATGVLTQLPVVFATQQPAGDQSAEYNLLGERVVVRATPTWTWSFGDGGALTTNTPGGRYPDLSVSHTYRRAGQYDVTVRTQWAAEFSVDGLGPFPITRAVNQESSGLVAVGEGRAVLAVR